MTEITRDVMLDLLPLYLAGEASAESMALVDAYLSTHPDEAEMVKQAKKSSLSEIPVPLSKDDAMQAFLEANKRMIQRTLLTGALFVVVFVGLVTLIMALIYGGFR